MFIFDFLTLRNGFILKTRTLSNAYLCRNVKVQLMFDCETEFAIFFPKSHLISINILNITFTNKVTTWE